MFINSLHIVKNFVSYLAFGLTEIDALRVGGEVWDNAHTDSQSEIRAHLVAIAHALELQDAQRAPVEYTISPWA